MEKKTIKLNETQLRKMIAESIKNLLSEYWDEDGEWVGGPDDVEMEKDSQLSYRPYKKYKYKYSRRNS